MKIDTFVSPTTEEAISIDMYKYLLLFSLSLVAISCDNTTQYVPKTLEVSLLPQPKSLSLGSQTLVLSPTSKTYSSNSDIYPLLDLFQTEIGNLTGIEIGRTTERDKTADMLFELDGALSESAYNIKIEETIQVSGGSYQALTMAKTTLLQLASKEGENLAFPVVEIEDQPDAAYRGLMIDLARKWHTMGTLKKLIDLAAFYKLNYVQLHFTDYQSYTLPSRKYPKLSTPGRHYSFEELEELEAYSQLRGVTIIPEIDIPGHSSPFVEAYPEIFALKDVKTNPYIINMGKEEAYQVLDELIRELTEVFKTSPYFHIGGDEAYLEKVMDDHDVKAYIAKHELEEEVHEIYRHFLVRLNDIVKKYDKQMCVWEGFTREGKIQIPKDLLVFEFETNRYLPNHLIEDGYTVVNTSWKPLYVVNQKKWEPRTIYNWNLWRWENWWPKAPSHTPIQLEQTPLIIGAQMCAWEQKGEVAIPSLRKRVPTFLERIWNTAEAISYEQFILQLAQTDKRLSLLIKDDRQDSLLIGHNFEVEPEN